MEIRLAKNEEGQTIRKMFSNGDQLLPSDWTDIYPYWAVAVVDDVIVAALQICLSKPIGRLEHLLVHKDANKITATKAADKLIKYGEKALKNNGCTKVSGYVTFRNKPIKNLIKKHYEAQLVDSGSMWVWRIK